PQRPAHLRPRRAGLGGGGRTARPAGESPAAGAVRARAAARGAAPSGPPRWRHARDGDRGPAPVGGAGVRKPQARRRGGATDGGVVHEAVLLAVLRRDETEPLRVVQPLHDTGNACHLAGTPDLMVFATSCALHLAACRGLVFPSP